MSDIIGRDRALGMVLAAHAYFNEAPIGTHWYWSSPYWEKKDGYEDAPEKEFLVDDISHPDLIAKAQLIGRKVLNTYGSMALANQEKPE